MLYEIICDKFVSYGKQREPLIFHEGLNIIKGQNNGTNSIGKSTALLAIDFAFGGDTYAKEQTLINNIGNHIVKFCFKFGDKFYYYSRNTETPNKINVCDSNYNIKKTITDNAFQKELFNLYNIDLKDITFRQIVGRFARIYGRENTNEKDPLAIYYGEPQQESMIAYLKIFNKYDAIKNLVETIEKEEQHKKAITQADNFNLVKLISKKSEYKQNIEQIEQLQMELKRLSSYGKDDLLYLEPKDAEKAAELRERYDSLTRQKKQLWSKYYLAKNNISKATPTTKQDFQSLTEFFPNSNIELLENIEKFHSKITEILNSEFKQSMTESLSLINQINSQLEEIESQLKDLELPKRISENTLKAYAQTQSQINELTKENELYNLRDTILKDIKTLKAEYEKLFLETFSTIINTVNESIIEYNNAIYGQNVEAPLLNVVKSNAYEYKTKNNNGTGENYKNLILLDLATLKLTQLPIIIHDTPVFKHIGQDAFAKLLEIYNSFNKQIFIAIDESNKYNLIAQNIINEKTVLELSANGNELFGSPWSNKN